MAVLSFALIGNVFAQGKTYLMIGITGSGKSTLGNCMYNRRGDWPSISQRPFATSDSSAGCTKIFELVTSDKMTIVDTVGFGDPQFSEDPKFIFEQFRDALTRVNNQVDAVIYVVRQGRFSDEVVQFFEFIQEKVLKGKLKHNSILVVTSCEKGWLEKSDQKNNKFIQRALENTNQKSYEFYLRKDDRDDDEDDLVRNQQRRQKSIDAMVAFMDSMQFQKIDLSYVQSADFEREWYEQIVPFLKDLVNKIEQSLNKAINVFNDIGGKIKDIFGKRK